MLLVMAALVVVSLWLRRRDRRAYERRLAQEIAARAVAERIASDVRLAKFLAAEVDRRPDFERLAESVLSIANFRYRPPGKDLPDAELDRLNRRYGRRLVSRPS